MNSERTYYYTTSRFESTLAKIFPFRLEMALVNNSDRVSGTQNLHSNCTRGRQPRFVLVGNFS